jgi:hypothetical protein
MKQEDTSSNISTTKSFSQPSSPQQLSTSLSTEKIKIERNLSAPTSPLRATSKGGGKRFNPYVIPKSEK